MARPCTICEHAERDKIDTALVSETHRVVAKRFGMSEAAVYRHKSGHLARTMARTSKRLGPSFETIPEAPEVIEIARADRLVDRVESLRTRAMRLLDDVEKGDDTGFVDYKALASLLREARGCVELQAKLLGEMQAGSAANTAMVEGVMRVVLAVLAEEPALKERVIAAVRAEIEARRKVR